MQTKNPGVRIGRYIYEITFLTRDADHIARTYFSKEDPGDHLSFTDIENVLRNATVVRKRSDNRFLFASRIDHRKYVVLAYLVGRRCIVKSGRICNFDDILNAPEWQST